MTQVSVSAATNKTLESDKGAFLKELEEKEPGKYKALELLVKDFSPGEITPVFSKSAPAPSGGPPDNIVYDFFFKSPQGLAMGIEDIASIAGIASDWLAMSTSQRYGAQGKKWKEEVNKKYTKPALDALKMLAPVVYEGYMGYQSPSVENVPARAEALRVGGALAEGMREEIGERGAFGVVHPAEIAAVPFVPKMSKAAKTVLGDVKAGIPESTGRSLGPGMVPQRPGSRAIVRGRPVGGGFDGPEGPEGPSEDIQEILNRSREIREAGNRRRAEVEEDNRSYEEVVGEAPPLGASKEEWDKFVAKRDKWLKQKGKKDKERLEAKHVAMIAAIGEHPGITEPSLTARERIEKSFEYDRKAILWQIENGYLPESATPAYLNFEEYLTADPLDITGIPKKYRAYKRLDSRELAFLQRVFSDDFIKESFKSKDPGISLHGQTLIYDDRRLSDVEDFLENFAETFPGQYDPKPPRSLTERALFERHTRSDIEEKSVRDKALGSLRSDTGELPIGMATQRPPRQPIPIDEYQGMHRRVFAGGGNLGGVRGVGGLAAPTGTRISTEERNIGIEGIQGAESYNMGEPILSQVQWTPDQLEVLTNYQVYHEGGDYSVLMTSGTFQEKYPGEDYAAYMAEYARRKEAYAAQMEQVYQELDALKKANIESQQDPYNPVGRKLGSDKQNIRELFLIDYPDIGSYYGLTLENSFEVLEGLAKSEAKTLSDYLKNSLNEISDPVRLQREWANPTSSSYGLNNAFISIRRNIEKYNETDPAKRKPLARDTVTRREDEDLSEGQVNIPRPDSPVRPSPALTNYIATRHDPNTSVLLSPESIRFRQIAEDQNVNWSTVREALQQEDLLGFDTVAEAASAILRHSDWENRWEIASPGNLSLLRDFTGVSERPSEFTDVAGVARRERETSLNEVAAMVASMDFSEHPELSDYESMTQQQILDYFNDFPEDEQNRLIPLVARQPEEAIRTLNEIEERLSLYVPPSYPSGEDIALFRGRGRDNTLGEQESLIQIFLRTHLRINNPGIDPSDLERDVGQLLDLLTIVRDETARDANLGVFISHLFSSVETTADITNQIRSNLTNQQIETLTDLSNTSRQFQDDFSINLIPPESESRSSSRRETESPSELPDPDTTQDFYIRRAWLENVAGRLAEGGEMSLDDAQNYILSISTEDQDRLIDAMARGADHGTETTPEELTQILENADLARPLSRELSSRRDPESTSEQLDPDERTRRSWLWDVAERVAESGNMSREDVQNRIVSISTDDQNRLIDAYVLDNNLEELVQILTNSRSSAERAERIDPDSFFLDRDRDRDPVEEGLEDSYQEEAQRTAGLISDWMTSEDHVDLAAPTILGTDIHEFGSQYIERPAGNIEWENPNLPHYDYIALWDNLPLIEDLDVAMTQWDDTALNNVVQYVSSFLDFPGVTDMAPNFPRDQMASAKINQEFIKNNKNWDSKLLGADEEGSGLGFMDLSETWGEGAEQVRNREKAVAVINEWRKRQLGGNDF